jgi:photosystem II stability/assembly factor-like uncharacterized protein
VLRIQVDASKPSTLHAGTVNGGFFRSLDSGQTWSASKGFGSDNIYCLLVDPSDARTVLAGTDGGLYRSDDAGTTWTRTSFTYRVLDIVADPRNNGVLFISARNAVYRSSDHGATWTGSVVGASDITYRLALDHQTPTTIYAATLDTSGLSGHIYRSDDAAATWTLVSAGLPVARPEGIVVDPITPVRVYAAFDHGGVFRSDDRGDTWHPLGSNLDPYTLTSLAIDSDGSTLYATSKGVFSLDLTGLKAPVSTIRKPPPTRTVSPRP